MMRCCEEADWLERKGERIVHSGKTLTDIERHCEMDLASMHGPSKHISSSYLLSQIHFQEVCTHKNESPCRPFFFWNNQSKTYTE